MSEPAKSEDVSKVENLTTNLENTSIGEEEADSTKQPQSIQ